MERKERGGRINKNEASRICIDQAQMKEKLYLSEVQGREVII